MRYPGASLWLLTIWNASFIIFTVLQLSFQKHPLYIGSLPLLSLSDAIEFAVPWVIAPLYWLVWSQSFRETARPRFWRHLFPMILGTVMFTHGHGVHLR